MATLVLSTVGTLLGGPLGGAIGSLLGQSIDQQLFGPGPRHGPRLGDLSVQTSSYGTAIPRIFGTMRVAGSIIWSTDLQEASQTEGAKGQPDTVTYSYSASFAVALSSRPIGSVGRIWADGKLIRTAEGEFTVATGFRLCSGSEDQVLDPLIASIEGMESTPAYRGLALAVFEDMQLAEFGNRIPFLTFEVEADPGPVTAGAVLADVSRGIIKSSAATAVRGYAAHGASIASALEPLVDVCAIPLFDDGSALASPTAEIAEISEVETGCATGAKQVSRLERTQIPARNLPSAVSLGYYDPARDYQTGVARASLDDRGGTLERVELPVVIDAAAAKALAETSLGRRWAERDRLTVQLPPKYARLKPGALLVPPESNGQWRAERITVEQLVVRAELRPLHSTIDTVPADPGRVLPSLGVAPAPTTVAVLELPDDGIGSAESPVVVVAATSTSPSWRAVPLEVETAGSVSMSRTAAARAVIGTAVGALAGNQSAAFDMLNSVEVQLGFADSWLESRDDDELAAGANLAMLGNELIQFGDVLPLGSGRFLLSRLLRGRRGTEWAMPLHAAGESFVVLDPARLQRLAIASSHAGALLRVTASGPADGAGAPVEAMVTGEAMRPPCPVQLRASTADGDLQCSWVRRSKLGWAWLDGVDAPLGCSAERYRVTLAGPIGTVEIETQEPRATFTAAQLSVAGSGAAEVSVVQIGDLAASHAATLPITIS